MAASKRIGFLWSQEKLTLVEYQKNTPLVVHSSALSTKANFDSPFSSNLTEDIQITALLLKMLQDNMIKSRSFYVSLPVNEIILRSFVIPYIKPSEASNAVRFEAKKYLPIDIQDLSFTYYSVPFTENKIKRLQIIFFAVRKELLERHQHIFKQVGAEVSCYEPSMVSLSKVLLSRKDIEPNENFAFLTLEKDLGRICFIDQGVPQFIREFSIGAVSPLDGAPETGGSLNVKIVNEVANSFDFYQRQFTAEHITQMLVSVEGFGSDLFDALEAELKISIKTMAPVITASPPEGKAQDMDMVYAMGACVDAPLSSLSGINFSGVKNSPKLQIDTNFLEVFKSYKEIVFIVFMSAILLIGLNVFFKVQLNVDKTKFDQLSAKEGAYQFLAVENVQNNVKDTTDKLAAYKGIRTSSQASQIMLRIAAHIPKGAMLTSLALAYGDGSAPAVDMQGNVVGDGPNDQILVIDQIFADIKNDKVLSQILKNVSLGPLNHNDKSTDFSIHCS